MSRPQNTSQLVSGGTNLQATVESLRRLVNGMLSLGTGTHGSKTGNLNNQWLDIPFPSTANLEVSVPHSLGRVPVGVVVAGQSAAGSIYDSRKSEWTKSVLFLKCSTVSVNARIMIV